MSSAAEVARLLQQRQAKVVLAESCTGGLVAAQLANIPGISNWFCGSAVTYRSATKIAWLGVAPSTLDQHTAVSGPVAAEMIAGILAQTPESDLAAAVTGHLGPDAPRRLDGVVFIATKWRSDRQAEVSRHLLSTSERTDRQREAADLVLQRICLQLG